MYAQEGYKKLNGNAAAGLLTFTLNCFNFIFELGRHFALLQLAAGTTVELVPSGVFGGSLTNEHVLNFAFSTSMLLCLRSVAIRASTGGRQFCMVVSRVNLHPVYEDDEL